MENKEREDIMKMFNDGKFNILIATRLLARGYDNREVGLVI
jgi:superfamily II DNA/RNA helicase